jgi:hypothetical protein
LACGYLFRIEETRERANRNVNSAADHDMLKLTGLNQVADLALGDPNTRGELLWGLQPIVSFGCYQVGHRFTHRISGPRQSPGPP